MALVQSGDIAWNESSFNFHLALGTGATFSFDPATPTNPGPFTFTLYGHSRSLRTHTPNYDHSLTQANGDHANTLLGFGLKIDSKGHLTAGTILGIIVSDPVNSHVAGILLNTSIDAVLYQRAANSIGTADDLAILRQGLMGNDLVGLSDKSDRFHGYTGIDLVFGNGGNDWLYLGDGSDGALGGTGVDRLFGQNGDDVLIGNQGNDKLAGGTGRDLLDGGRNNDLLHGGADADTFYFAKGDGSDIIDDFDPLLDVIDIGSGATSFAQMHLQLVGDDTTVITFADVSITLQHVKPTDLTAADFHFIPDQSYLAFNHVADVFDFKV